MPERNSKTGVTVAEPMSYTHIRGRQPEWWKTIHTSSKKDNGHTTKVHSCPYTSDRHDEETSGAWQRLERRTTHPERAGDRELRRVFKDVTPRDAPSTRGIAYDLDFHPENPTPRTYEPPSMKKGGEVKKTGVYLLHKGEHVIPKKYTKKRDEKKKKCPH